LVFFKSSREKRRPGRLKIYVGKTWKWYGAVFEGMWLQAYVSLGPKLKRESSFDRHTSP
jgi:hypothetical protein